MAEKVEYVITLKDQGFSSTVDKANSKVNGLEGSLGKMAKLAVGAFAVNSIVDFAKDITTTGAKFEAYEIQLSTLLKDSGKAHEVFSQIKKDAASTPFDTESLVQANAGLISAGDSAEGARDTVMGLANAIAAAGKGSAEMSGMAANLQQIKNLGKASAMDIKQFGMAGINIYQMLANATGKNIDEVKGMEVSYDLLSMALQKSAKAGGMYEGALDKMAKSTAGQVSNLEEAITFLKVDVFQAFQPVINEVISGMANMVNYIVDAVKWGRENIDSLSQVFAPIKKAIQPVIDAVGNLINKFQTAGGEGSILEKTFNAIGNILEFISPLLDAIGETAATVIDTVGILAKGVMDFVERFQKPIMGLATAVRNVFVSIWQSAKQFIGGVGNLVAGILSGDLDQIKKGLSGIGESVKKGNIVTLGYEAATGFSEGYEKGLNGKNFFGNKKTTDGLAGGSGNSTGPSSAALAGSNTSGVSSASGRVQSVKPTTININIENLVRQLEIITQNIGIPKNQIASEISKVLVGAVVDSQRLAGI